MNRYKLPVAAIGIALVAGCASMDKQAAVAEDKEEKTYVTGSRLPVRDGRANRDVKSVTSKQEIDNMVRPGGTATGGVLGAGSK